MREDFPNAPVGWSPDDAVEMSRDLGVELSDEHWDVIASLQEYFIKHEFNNRRELNDALDERFHATGGLKRLYQLLPGGPVNVGCQLAGIEPPSGTVDASFGSVL